YRALIRGANLERIFAASQRNLQFLSGSPLRGMTANREPAGELHRSSEWPLHVCAVTRWRFPVGASPTRQTLQPEATGAVMEVTKWLKPSECVSRIGDSARVQAVTRVHVADDS